MLSLWVGYHLLLLCLYQEIPIREDKLWISLPELIFTLGIFGLAIERYINAIKSLKGRNDRIGD